MSVFQKGTVFDGACAGATLPKGLALIEGNHILSYEQLASDADRIVAGIPERSLVLLVADNTIASVLLYVGLIRHRSVPLMVKHELSDLSLKALVDDYCPGYVWCESSRDVKGDVVLEERDHTLTKTDFTSPELYPSLALLLTTSGSTGSQKYVRISYDNLMSNARSIVEYLGIVPDDRAVTTLPFSYSYGISIVNSHLLAGASIVLSDKSLFDRAFWNEFRTRQITTFGGVPYTYQMLKRLHFERMELPSLRYITQAGGRLGVEMQNEFGEACANKGIDFVVMYGQTEGTARLSFLPANRCLDKLGSIGVPIPGGSLSLMDENGAIVTAADSAGELVYRGPNVSLGYASSAGDLALGDERGGVLATGDIAKRDEEGFYYIVGRKKRFLKIFGNRVNLDEVESLLLAQGFIAACAGDDDSMRIYVERGDKAEVQKFVSEATGLFRGAFTVKQVESLPRNAAGKILYSELEG